MEDVPANQTADWLALISGLWVGSHESRPFGMDLLQRIRLGAYHLLIKEVSAYCNIAKKHLYD